MTALTPVVPSKAKGWIALGGGLLTAAVPLVNSLLEFLPPQWAAAVSAVIALLTAFGVVQLPNKLPPGDVVVADDGKPYVAPQAQPPASAGPWR
jgi:hypothetical protein